ncbi:hypothetical protein MNBD_ALPHA06-1648 [hydrothermal vent metagenome]|uniref:Uncharacterized protein n=1 Tax=hydrothermal vent metagenome TaxID=652676 RepID=A0A3B0R210_9ZZZZ
MRPKAIDPAIKNATGFGWIAKQEIAFQALPDQPMLYYS